MANSGLLGPALSATAGHNASHAGPRIRLRRDVLPAVAAVGLDTILFTRLTEDQSRLSWARGPVNTALIVALGGVAVLVLVLRRRAPVAVALVMCAHAAVITLAIGSRPLISLLVALYTAAAWARSLRLALWCLAATLAVNSLAVAYEAYPLDPSERGLDAVLVASVFVICDVAAFSIGRWAAATRSRAWQLEASRAAAAAAAVSAERLRIARELHDIVAHSVTVMVLQAAGARRVAATEPAAATDAMRAIEVVGKQAMAEMRRLLQVLRAVADADPREDSSQGPGLSSLPELVDQLRSAGIAVTVHSAGEPEQLDVSVDLSAYRIVQEALTNVTRHAGPGSATLVQLTWNEETLVVDVTDDGRGTPEQTIHGGSSGLGLVGISERVKVFGGKLYAGPLAGGGFRVTAVLPTRPAAPHVVGPPADSIND